MSKSSPDRTPNTRSPGMGLLILSLIFRFLLLVVTSGFSWVLGMAIAFQYPSTTQEIPIAEKLLRGVRGIVSQKKLSQSSRSTPASTPEIIMPKVEVTEAQRKELQTELQELQTQLNSLIGRTRNLENQLGLRKLDGNLEARLDLISQQLALPISARQNKQVINKPSQPVFSENTMMVTLPSDVLFESGSNTIRSEGRSILDNLISELKNYPEMTISVSGHTDNRGKIKANQEKSFLQAERVTEYFSKNMGDRYRFLVIGYGESSPIVENNSKTNRQRNRRIEVKIHKR
ncbi:OmpA family protein [Okeania sp. SIO1I7]|uniref:OmpA family protein n=1 Tax=Okeania sp. SIO1I7 TaxID=2607772 RepID=UPI0025F51F01|nr:OmpA family protein [Okeania sp. SIO1I7]